VLRAESRRRRRLLALKNQDAPSRAAANLAPVRLPPFKVVAGYLPIGSEIDPWPVLARLAAFGALTVMPRVVGPGAPLGFEGDDPSIAATPDLIIAPLLAFDRAGGRLGQGGGHYDRTIGALRARAPVFVIGLAYAGQEVAAVPCEPHDQRLDAILTELGYIEVRKDN
jgi:5-formyltetrahydrofolate cyclo-ligase